ncbi:MAG: hypothetical protein J0L57_06950 [Burkholderiales bacterium]|nr:hypothetical protein [Burkholderiales bacterium]
MSDAAWPVSEAERPRVAALIEELARHGLGVFRPHAHDPAGAIVPLPPGEVALERDRRVDFVAAAAAPARAVAVGWRWGSTGVEVCALCCTPDDEAPPI